MGEPMDAPVMGTALRRACQMGDLPAVEALLRRASGDMNNINSDSDIMSIIEAPARDGCTPLWLAAQEGHVECLKLLLKSGGEVGAANTAGVTPVMVAAHAGHVECVKILLEAGADPREEAMGGNTLAWAEAGGYQREVSQLLQQWIPPPTHEDEFSTPWRINSSNYSITNSNGIESSVWEFYEPKYLTRQIYHTSSDNVTLNETLSTQPIQSENGRSQVSRNSFHRRSNSRVLGNQLKEMIERENEENELFKAQRRKMFQAGKFRQIPGVLQPINAKETHAKWDIWKRTIQERLNEVKHRRNSSMNESLL